MMIKPDQFDQLIFISDVHLGAFSSKKNDEIEQDLIALVNFAREEHAALFILGDLFDYWMEYPSKNFTPPLGKDFLNAVEAYNKEVFQIPFITGNHDHWTYGYLESIGFRVEHSFIELLVNNDYILLTHGDGMMNGEFGLELPKLHKTLKNPDFIKWYQRLLPPSLGLALMKYFSKVNAWFPDEDPEPLNNWAVNCLNEYDFNVIICGHDHIPRQETLSSKLYLNLGTFYGHKTVGLYKNSELSLVTWDSEGKKFQHYL